MGCSDCQELLSDYLDGLLELGEQTGVERHLSSCGTCRVVRDDLLQIIHFSRTLPLPTPSTSLWADIKSGIENDEPARSWWPRVGERRFTFSAGQMAAAAATLVLVFAAGLLAARSGLAPRGPEAAATQTAESQRAQAQSVAAAITDIEQRVGRLEETVEQRMPVWNAELRTAFDRQMFYVDQSLAECRQGLRANPYDDVCQDLMLTAYREKVRLLEGFSNY